jgi:predicted O-methyltransferase YrrM
MSNVSGPGRPKESPLDTLALQCLGRRISHLTPRYAFDLANLRAFELRYPDAPWLTPAAVAILDSALRSSDRGLEYGSGRSTLWFARRTAHLISVECDLDWYARIQSQLTTFGRDDRVDYRYIPADEANQDDPARTIYLSVAEDLSERSLDYILIDGVYRDQCALRSVDLLKAGGVLIIDNANWFLPNRSHSPMSVRSFASSGWQEFLARVSTWRLVWTSSGVTDTALWFAHR